jgi:hypothetical protein
LARSACAERPRTRLFERDLGGDRIGAEHEHHGIGLHDQRFDTRPPVLEGVDILAVDQRHKIARGERRFQTVREGHVLAGIGDEHIGFDGAAID